jgi:hypothetical protein
VLIDKIRANLVLEIILALFVILEMGSSVDER